MVLALAAGFTAGCKSAVPRPQPQGKRQLIEEGLASWYGPGFQGRRTANGEVFDGRELTAAHRTLPFNSLVEVVSLDNAQSVVVRINDRGPFIKRRVIDLSHAAADALGMVGPGVAKVQLYLLGEAPSPPGEPCTVQVGAFQEPERARELARDLAPRFPGVEVRTDGTWHRVQISRFTDRSAAEALRRKLVELGFAALVVPLSEAAPTTP